MQQFTTGSKDWNACLDRTRSGDLRYNDGQPGNLSFLLSVIGTSPDAFDKVSEFKEGSSENLKMMMSQTTKNELNVINDRIKSADSQYDKTLSADAESLRQMMNKFASISGKARPDYVRDEGLAEAYEMLIKKVAQNEIINARECIAKSERLSDYKENKILTNLILDVSKLGWYIGKEYEDFLVELGHFDFRLAPSQARPEVSPATRCVSKFIITEAFAGDSQWITADMLSNAFKHAPPVSNPEEALEEEALLACVRNGVSVRPRKDLPQRFKKM